VDVPAIDPGGKDHGGGPDEGVAGDATDHGGDAEDQGATVDDGLAGDQGGGDYLLPADTSTEVNPLAGKVKVSPVLIDFGYVAGGQIAKLPFSVINVGTGALVISKFTIKGSPELSLAVGFEPKLVGDVVEYEVHPAVLLKSGAAFQDGLAKFVPVTTSEVYAEGRVFTNDPEYPDGFPFHIQGNKKAPCLKAVPSPVDFGPVIAGQTVQQPVKLESCGMLPVALIGVSADSAAVQAGISLGFEDFPDQVPPNPGSPLSLDPGDKVTLRVNYAPLQASPLDAHGLPVPFKGDVMVLGDMFAGALFLDLKGFAVAGACAMPYIEVSEGTQVPMGTLLHLSGLKSYSPFGKVTQFAWTVDQPPANAGSIFPDAAQPDVTFMVGVPGDYVFHLSVTDEAGHGPCQEAVLAVKAAAQDTATFVLTWKTVDPIVPAPPYLGPDLDLHFLHPNAKGVDADKDGKPDGWYDMPWDCFWYNAAPQWDSPQPDEWFNDDAKLLYDNQDGSGPEVIVMGLKCKAGNVYRLGAHFFDDHGYGPVTATIQAYVSGTLVYAKTVGLASLDMWDIARFNCGPNTVTEVPGPAITHGYVNPSFVIPP